MGFCYSLKPPCQPDIGCHWEKSLYQTPSGSAESDRRGQKCTSKPDLCINSTAWGNLNERTADNLTWQQHSTPRLSSSNEFREYEKTQVMNHFHYAYILIIRLGLPVALHSREYEMQENQEACKRWHRKSTGLSPTLPPILCCYHFLKTSHTSWLLIQCDANNIKSTAGILVFQVTGSSVPPFSNQHNSHLNAAAGPLKTWQIYHTIARDGKIKANEETTQDIDFSGLQDVSDRPGSVAFGIL